MIRISGLHKAFAGRQVLAGVNLTIDGPTVLMGPSGQERPPCCGF